MKNIFSILCAVVLVAALAFAACAPVEEEEQEEVTELPLTPVFFIPQLNFELDDFVGQRVWASGYYGDSRMSGGGYGFLVTDFDMLLVREKLPDHSYVVLDGTLPPYEMNGAEILLYGVVKDFAETYDAFTLEPTPLITVEQYYVLSPPVAALSSSHSFSGLSSGTAAPQGFPAATQAYAEGNGTRAKACDRALILSGGVCETDHLAKVFRDEVVMKYEKLKALNFTDEQIVVLYNNATAINVGPGPVYTNIVDGPASKQSVNATLEEFSKNMTECCTLTIMVDDHGTGYNQDQCYHGARPALDPTRESGKNYTENTLKVDLQEKVYPEKSRWITENGKYLKVERDATGQVQVYRRQGGTWVLKGGDADSNGFISEAELDEDVNGDGVKASTRGWRVTTLQGWLASPIVHRSNQWDTDRDSHNDTRVTWNETTSRYVIERLVGGAWQKMGEDTNGDFVIDSKDEPPGIDWNLNSNRNDQIGFHEGINLWGKEVLWDDELAEMLKPLSKKGIHILVEMVQCFSGGFIENLKGRVDKIVTFASEDTKNHIHYRQAADGTWCGADQGAFVGNLTGIDRASWNKAFEAGKAADTAAWGAAGCRTQTKNYPDYWEAQDASIKFRTWTRNGVPIEEYQCPSCQPGYWRANVTMCDIIDAQFQQHVAGPEGHNVTVNETSWLKITQVAGHPGVQVFVVDDRCAVNKTPEPIEKVSQVPSINNLTVQKGNSFNLTLQAPTLLDVRTVWKLVKCVNYTKTINWLRISKAPFEPCLQVRCILFNLVMPVPGQYTFTLEASAEVALVDDVEVNLGNNKAVSLPLLLTVFVE